MADQYRSPYDDGRGWSDRAGDEVRSWFGDEEAQQRRSADSRRDEQDDRERGRPRQPWGDRNTWPDRSAWAPRPDRDSERWRGGNADRQFSPHRSEEDWRGRGDSSTARQWRGTGPRDEGGYGGGWGERSGARTGWDSRGQWDPAGYAAAANDDWRSRTGHYGTRMDTASGMGRQSGGYAGRGPKGYQRSDERIREDVCDRLADDEHIDASDVTVEVRDAEVTLSGTINDREQKRRAEDCSDNVSGVRNVINNLRVSRSVAPQPGEGGVLGITGQGAQTDARPKSVPTTSGS